MTRSLAGRLLVGVISLVVLGLLISDVATYEALQQSLLNRTDQQLTARSTVETAVHVIQSQCHPGQGGSADYPAGTVTELIDPVGKVLASCRVQ